MAIVVFTGLTLIMANCQKQQESQIQNNPIDEQSREVMQHILDFKARMEYYKQNPNLKAGGETYTADSAALELESLLNFDFCYTDIECNKKTFETSEVILPLDILERINDPNLMQVYYDKVIDTIQAQMGRVNYSNMKLLLVDLEVSGYNSNGDAIVSVSSLIGNEQNVVLHNDSWMYGENLGMCGTGNYAPEDAAKQLDKRVTINMQEQPPSGGRWYFTNIEPLYCVPTQDQLDPIPNNHRDYKIYYATSTVGLIDDNVKCLSLSDMVFYENHYVDYAEAFEITSGKYFNYCNIAGNPYLNYQNDLDHIQHDYYIYVGNRFVEYVEDIGDILLVN